MVDKTSPEYNWVMSRSYRRPFSTNEFLDGAPVTLNIVIGGHKAEKTFRKYFQGR